MERRWLPEDIVVKILLKLPVKSVLRLQNVCQRWRALLSDPFFQEAHHQHWSEQEQSFLLIPTTKFNRSGSSVSLLFNLYNGNNGTFVSSFSEPISGRCGIFEPIQSCRGLVCMWDSNKKIVVSNPAMRKLIHLPPNTEVGDTIGFGYCCTTKEYKVVRFYQSESRFSCKVFVLGTSENWREASFPPPVHFRPTRSCHAPYFNGTIHVLPEVSLDDPQRDYCSLVFDIQTENWKETKIPNFLFPYTERDAVACWMSTHMDSEGSIYWVCEQNKTIDVWILNDFNTQDWVKSYVIDISGYNYAIPTKMLKNGFLMLEVDGFGLDVHCVHIYNPEDHVLTAKSPSQLYNASAVWYLESMFSPWEK